MNKSLLAFAVAFGLSLGFSLVSLVVRGALLTFATPTNILIAVSGLVAFFGAFYLLAHETKTYASKSTALAVLLGVLLGPLIPITVNPASPVLYLTIIGGSMISGVILFFLPATAALLYAEWRTKKSSSSLPEVEEVDSEKP